MNDYFDTPPARRGIVIRFATVLGVKGSDFRRGRKARGRIFGGGGGFWAEDCRRRGFFGAPRGDDAGICPDFSYLRGRGRREGWRRGEARCVFIFNQKIDYEIVRRKNGHRDGRLPGHREGGGDGVRPRGGGHRFHGFEI